MADVTNDLVSFLKQRLIGYDVHQPLKTIDRDVTSVPFGGEVGSEIKARGSAEITEFVGHIGTLAKIEVGNYRIWATDPHFIFTLRYRGSTGSERRTVPGGAVIDKPWGDIHPKGSLKATLFMRPQHNAELKLEVDVDADHNDRPGHFVRDHVVRKVIDKIDGLLEEFTGVSVNSHNA
jgi:hypothetical protein